MTRGWVPATDDGYTASATPEASAIGSPPGTRVVFFVATVGKPRRSPALGVFELTPTTGPGPVISSVLPPHAASPAAMARSARSLMRRIGGGEDVSGRVA